jgi:hypothetical protein
MTRKELRKQLLTAIEITKHYRTKYGEQIKKCNSPKSTEKDFELLSHYRQKWDEATANCYKYEVQLYNIERQCKQSKILKTV